MLQKRVLLTGPSGRVGPHLIADFDRRYELHTFDLMPSERPRSHVGTLQDVDSLRRAMRGMDVVMHLAATSDEAPFIEELVPNNVEGLYNVLDAAHLEGVKRIVFTSSVQAVSSHFDKTEDPIETDINAPSSLYGVTKICGELLGRWFYERHGLEFVAIRLGWFQPNERVRPDNWINNIWISPGDAVRLFGCAIDTPDVGFAIVNGTSKTPREVLSLFSARQLLGYEPQDTVPDAGETPAS